MKSTRGRRPFAALAALAGLVALSLAVLPGAPEVRAHGGEDHGAGPARAAPADPDHPRVPIETQFLLGLRTARAGEAAMAPGLGQVGTVVPPPDGEQRVVAPFQGRLVAPEGGFPRLGQVVKKGQHLGTVRPVLGGGEGADVRLARTDAASRLEQAKARLALAERELTRLRGLRGIVADKEILAAEGQVEILKAELAKARADVAGLSGEATSERLTAAIGGTIVAADPALSGQIAEGTELFRIVDLSELWVDVRVPEQDARGIAERAEMALLDDPGVRFEGKRVAVAPLVDPATRRVRALFAIEGAEPPPRVGALVSVRLASGKAETRVVVPEAALVERAGQPAVIVKTAPELFEVRPVSIAARSAGQIGLGAGVKPGERVVVSGATAVLLAASGS